MLAILAEQLAILALAVQLALAPALALAIP